LRVAGSLAEGASWEEATRDLAACVRELRRLDPAASGLPCKLVPVENRLFLRPSDEMLAIDPPAAGRRFRPLRS
jgi:hypothetical protein